MVHYEGGGQHEKRMSAALATIKALHYKNESVFAYEDFSCKLLEAFQDLKDTDEELSEFQKVKLLLEKIQITQPRAEVAKSHVHQNFRADVDQAIAYLGTEFADMFVDAIAYKRGKSGIGALSQEPAYKRGKHEDGPQHRPDRTLIFFGVNVTDVSHSFSADEFNDLGPRGQAYIFQERESALASLTHHNLATSTRVKGRAKVEEEEDTITWNVRLELLVRQMNSVP